MCYNYFEERNLRIMDEGISETNKLIGNPCLISKRELFTLFTILYNRMHPNQVSKTTTTQGVTKCGRVRKRNNC